MILRNRIQEEVRSTCNIYYISQSLHCGTISLGVLEGQTCKSLEKLSNGWTDWHQLWFTAADSSGNGHRLNTSRPQYTRGHLGGGGYGVTNSNVWGSCQTARPIGIKCGTCLRIRLGMDIAKYNSPFDNTGHFGGF